MYFRYFHWPNELLCINYNYYNYNYYYNYYIFLCLKYLLNLFLGCYKGVDFSIPHEENVENPEGFVDIDRSDIIARNEMEIIEQKFREMGLPTTEENEEKEDDEIRFGSFEDLNEISVQEQQQSLPFRNDM